MSHEIEIALVTGIIAMLGWGSSDFFAKKTVDTIGSLVSLVWAHLFGTSLFVFLALLQLIVMGKFIVFPQTLSTWCGLLFFGTLQMIVYWLVYEGFRKGQLSILNPVFASFSGVVAFISVTLFAEPINKLFIIALFAIFIGILLLNTDLHGIGRKKIKIAPGLKEVGLATIIAAIWTLGWDKFITGKDALSYALFMYAFMTVAAIVIAKILHAKLAVIPKKTWKYVFFIGAGEVVAYLAISIGYSTSPFTSIIALTSGAFSLPTIILARIFLHEKVSRIQTIGSIIIVLGILLLTL